VNGGYVSALTSQRETPYTEPVLTELLHLGGGAPERNLRGRDPRNTSVLIGSQRLLRRLLKRGPSRSPRRCWPPNMGSATTRLKNGGSLIPEFGSWPGYPVWIKSHTAGTRHRFAPPSYGDVRRSPWDGNTVASFMELREFRRIPSGSRRLFGDVWRNQPRYPAEKNDHPQ